MVDCGIMDTDSFPYPDVSEEELEKVDYLFLTHCHNDHAAAFSYLVEKGFNGWLIASRMTIALAGIDYEKTMYLPMEPAGKEHEVAFKQLVVNYGRSGHCPGSVWYYMEDAFGKSFFSGDYQADTLLYTCDEVSNLKADMAVVDCAHYQAKERANVLRKKLQEEIAALLQEDKKVILPVPKYGRGLEMLCMLRKAFPEASIKVDSGFITCSKEMLSEDNWYKKSALKEIQSYLEKETEILIDTAKDYQAEDFTILLIADTHLQKAENQTYVQAAVEAGAELVITGRIKKGSLPSQLYEKGQAKCYLYPHHQSRGDMKMMLAENKFKITYPFHNPLREVYVR